MKTIQYNVLLWNRRNMIEGWQTTKLILVITLIIGFGGKSWGQSEAMPKPIEWKIQTIYKFDSKINQLISQLSERVDTMSNGRLKLTIFGVGKFVPTFKILEAIEHGILEGAVSAPTYWRELDPAFAMFETPALWTHPWQLDTWMRYEGGLDLLRELYATKNVYVVNYMFFGIESFVSRVPLRGVDDFKGLRMRTPPGMIEQLFKKLGAQTMILPGAEIKPALEKGIIDAADWSQPSLNYSDGLYKIGKHSNFPGFHSMPLVDFIVRQKEWETLPPDLQLILSTAIRTLSWDLIEQYTIDDYNVVQQAQKEGVIFHAWNQTELNRVRMTAVKVLDEWSQKSPKAQKIAASQKIWLKKLGLIQ